MIRNLKNYKYKGVIIHIRSFYDKHIEFLLTYRGLIYSQIFDLETKGEKKELGAATLIVAQAAEKVVDELLSKYSVWYNIKSKLIFNTTHEEKTYEGDESPQQAAEQNQAARV